jgi:hypothetical protein
LVPARGTRDNLRVTTPPTSVPLSLIAGDTLTFERCFAGITPGPTITLAVYFNGPSEWGWQEAWVDENEALTGWVITVPGSATASLVPGTYRWFIRLTEGAAVSTVEVGTITVRPNPASAVPGAYQTFEEEALAVVRARLKGDLSGGIMDYTLYGRTVRRYALGDLQRMERRLAIAVAQQQGHGRTIQRIPMSFGRPG